MYNFFVDNDNFNENNVTINGDDYNHIKNVLRMSKGNKIQVCNKESGEAFLTEIDRIDHEEIICDIIEKLDSNESNVKVTVFQGIPKSDKMEYIIQKAVELGAYDIVPVEMKYCVAKIKSPEKKIKRWQTISEAAAKQSKRNIIPKIKNPINIKELCSEIQKYDLTLLAYENEKETNVRELLKNNKEMKNIAIIIGPEGGLSDEEVNILKDNKAKCISLGKRILRTETASIALLSMIMYEYEL